MFRLPVKHSASPSAWSQTALALLRALVNRSLVALFGLSVFALALAYQFPIELDGLSQAGTVPSGFYDLEGRTSPRPYRWTGEHAALWVPGIGRQPLRLVLSMASGRPDAEDLPAVSVWAGPARLAQFSVPRTPRDYVWAVPTDAVSWSGDLDLRVDAETFAPPGDLRALGVIVYGVRLESRRDGIGAVAPAPAPVAWGALALCLLFLALRRWGVPPRLAGGIALAGLALACGGIVFARLAAVAALPWAVLGAALAFVLAPHE